LFFKVSWEGLPDKRDATWRPIKELYTDIPDMVIDYLAKCKKKQLAAKVKRQLGIST